MKRSALQAALQAQVTEAVAAYVAWKEQAGECTFEALEAQALEVGQAVTRRLLEYGVADEGWAEQHERAQPEVVCGRCGQKLRAKGRRPKQVTSRVGEVGWEREYYHCARCQRGVFPPG